MLGAEPKGPGSKNMSSFRYTVMGLLGLPLGQKD